MTNLEALIGLNKVCDIGTIRLKELLNYFDKPQDILRASKEKLMAISGIGANIADMIHSLKKEDINKTFLVAIGLLVVYHWVFWLLKLLKIGSPYHCRFCS